MSTRELAGVDLDLSRVGLYAVLLAMIAFYLAPLESGLMTAFKTNEAFFSSTPFSPPGPGGATIGPWLEAWSRLQGPLTNLNGALFNSLLMAVPATVLSALLGSIAAYGLTNIDWRGQTAVLLLFVAGMFVPYQSVLVPLTRFWSIVGLSSIFAGVPFLADRAERDGLPPTEPSEESETDDAGPDMADADDILRDPGSTGPDEEITTPDGPGLDERVRCLDHDVTGRARVRRDF